MTDLVRELRENWKGTPTGAAVGNLLGRAAAEIERLWKQTEHAATAIETLGCERDALQDALRVYQQLHDRASEDRTTGAEPCGCLLCSRARALLEDSDHDQTER